MLWMKLDFLLPLSTITLSDTKQLLSDEDSQSLCIIMEFANDGDLLGKVNDHKKRG
jgi:hypothetical protein